MRKKAVVIDAAGGFDTRTLGETLKQARARRGLAMRTIADRAGYSVTHVSQIERGRTCPTIGALIRIARAVGHSVQYFLEPGQPPEVRFTPRSQVTAAEAVNLKTPGKAHVLRLSEGICGGMLQAVRATIPAHQTAQDGGELDASMMHAALVTRGRLVVTLGSEQFTFGPGDAVVVHCNQGVRFFNPGPEDVEVLALARNERAESSLR